MMPRARLLSLGLAILACIGSLSHAADSPPPVPTRQDLDRAMTQGDAAKAKEIAAALNMNKPSMEMLNAQLAYDLPKVMALSLSCRDAMLAFKTMPAALSCSTVAYRAALMRGDARETFRALSWIKHNGFSEMARQSGKPPGFNNAFDNVDVDQLANSLPPISSSLAPRAASLGYANAKVMTPTVQNGLIYTLAANDTRSVPSIPVEINGKKTEAATDTGNAYAIILDQSRADALGVKILVTGLPPMPTLGRGPVGTSLSLGLVDKLVAGPLTLRNVLAIVVPSGNTLTDRINIGMPLLKQFQQLTFTSAGLAIGGEPKACKEPLPLTFASTGAEEGHLVFDVKADGKVVKGEIDTGSASPLIAGNSLAPPGMKPANGSNPPTRYLSIRVGSAPFGYDDTEVMASLDVPAVVIGAPAIALWDIRYDFAGLSLCIEPRLPQPDSTFLPAQIKGAKEFNHAATEMIDRGEGFLPGIAAVEKLFEAARGSDTESAYAQFLGMFYTYVGAYDLAASVYPKFHLEKFEDRLNQQPDLELRPALDALQKLAKGRRAVFINENHGSAVTRVLPDELLGPLRAQGFTYFAMEALSYEKNESMDANSRCVDVKDRDLCRRGYSHLDGSTGAYTKEPIDGHIVRTALRLGYKVVAYDDDTSGSDELARDTKQAERIAAILKADPKAKIYVLAGFGHVDKLPDEMAGILRTKWGIDSLAIDQVALLGIKKSERFRNLQSTGDSDGSYVGFVNQGVYSAKPGITDVSVVRFEFSTNRQDAEWLSLGGARKPVTKLIHSCPAFPCLVQAFHTGEDTLAVPEDSDYIKVTRTPKLYLSPGTYRIVISAQGLLPINEPLTVAGDDHGLAKRRLPSHDGGSAARE